MFFRVHPLTERHSQRRWTLNPTPHYYQLTLTTPSSLSLKRSMPRTLAGHRLPGSSQIRSRGEGYVFLGSAGCTLSKPLLRESLRIGCFAHGCLLRLAAKPLKVCFKRSFGRILMSYRDTPLKAPMPTHAEDLRSS